VHRSLSKLGDNHKYAIHMISWLEKLGVPDISIGQESFAQVKEYWVHNNKVDLDELKNKLWVWVDSNNGYDVSNSDVAKMRIILCLAYDDNRELEDVGYFEDLLVSLGLTYEEAYKRT